MKLVVGLGNPGRKYEGTRHNVGYAVLDELARRHTTPVRRFFGGSGMFGGGSRGSKSKFQGDTIEVPIAGQQVLLLWPTTFMNLSGASVLAARDFYKLEHDDLLVVCDDFNLPLARLRLRLQGSAGGQKGLADVIGRLGTEKVPRLRIGVGPVPANWDPSDFVLSRFTKDDQKTIETAIVEAADAVTDWVAHGIDESMNKYNA